MTLRTEGHEWYVTTYDITCRHCGLVIPGTGDLVRLDMDVASQANKLIPCIWPNNYNETTLVMALFREIKGMLK